MAGKGTYSAYQKLTPYGDGVTEDIKYWNQDAASKRTEQRAIDKIAQDKADALQTKKDKRKKTAMDGIVGMKGAWDTGSMSLNEKVASTIMGAKDKLKELIPIIENKENYSDQEYLDAQFKFNNLLKTADNLAMTTKFMEDRHQGYLTARKTDSVFKDEKYEKSFQDGYANTYFTYDEKGSILVATKDTNKDGVVGIGDEVLSLEELKNGVIDHDYSFQKKVASNTIAGEIATTIGMLSKTTDNGYKSHKTNKAKADALISRVNDSLQSADGELTDYAKSELRIKGIDYKDKESSPEVIAGIKLIKEELTANVNSRLNEEDTVNITPSPTATEPKDPFGKSLADATPSFWNAGEGGDNKLDTDKYGVVSVPQKISLETLKIPDGDNGERTLTNASVISYTLDANGDFLFEVSHEVVKGATIKKPTGKNKGFDQADIPKAGEEGSDNSPDSTRTGLENKSEIVKVVSEKADQIASKLGTTIEAMKARATKKTKEKSKEKIDW